MSAPLRLVVTCLLAAAAAACAPAVDESAEFYVFGTLVEVRLSGAQPEQAEAIFATLQQEFQRMHRELHAWEPGELTRLNAALASGEAARTTAEIGTLIRRSKDYERASGGRFNPAIGKLVALWGFHTSDFPVTGPPPAEAAIRALRDARPSSLDLEVSGDTVISSNPAVQLDFGGIAKGYAIDFACDVIRASGIQDAIVNAGGDVRTLGDNRGKAWRIGVRDPSGGVAGGIEARDGLAVFTSGNYERFRQDADARYPHILDPRTGRPVQAVAAATVIARNGTTADAAATALVVAGPEDWPKVAEKMGIEAAMVIYADGRIHATPGMLEYFTPGEGREVIVTESAP